GPPGSENCEATSAMQPMMMATPRAPRMMAKGLARPSRRVSSAGKPNTPLPMMVLMTRAVIVQRPIDRISGIGVWRRWPGSLSRDVHLRNLEVRQGELDVGFAPGALELLARGSGLGHFPLGFECLGETKERARIARVALE